MERPKLGGLLFIAIVLVLFLAPVDRDTDQRDVSALTNPLNITADFSVRTEKNKNK